MNETLEAKLRQRYKTTKPPDIAPDGLVFFRIELPNG
jgi:hypothetical protein